MAKSSNQPDEQQETGLAQIGNNAFLGMMAESAAPIEVLRDEDGRAVGVDVETSQLEVPRLALVQKQSRVTDENIASAGDILSTLEMKVLWPLPQHRLTSPVPPQLAPFVVPGSEPPMMALPFLPLKVFVDQVMFNDQFELVCRSTPGGRNTVQGFRSPAWQEGDLWDPTVCANCPLKDWGADGEKPQCSLTYNCIGFGLNTDATDPEEILGMPMAATFSNTSAKTGKQIATTLKMSGRNPWSFVWLLWATKETKGPNTYYVWRAKLAQVPGSAKGLATPPPLADLAAAIFISLSDTRLNIDRETAAGAAYEEAQGPLADDPDEDVFGPQ